MEILRQHREPIDAIFVAVGGGGLIAGIAAYVKRLRPEIKDRSASSRSTRTRWTRSLRAGRRVSSPTSACSPTASPCKQVGEETFRLAATLRRRDDPGRHRRDLRRDQGRLRGHARDRSSRPARSASPARSATSSASGVARRDARRDRLRREHELRPPALRRRARRARRAARGGARGDDPRAARAASGVLPPASARATSPSSTTASPTRPRRTSSSASRCATARRQDELAARARAAAASRTLDLTDNELAKLHVRHMVGGRAPRAATSCSTASSSRSGPAR